jgi:general secretion pathway protein G
MRVDHAMTMTHARTMSTRFDGSGPTIDRPSAARRRPRAAGFSVIELVVVLALIAVLGGIATLGLPAILNSGKESATKASMQTIEQALLAYETRQNSYPPSLQALVDRELVSNPSDINDSWGTPFGYFQNTTVDGQRVPWLLISYGPNRMDEQGGGDDIVRYPGMPE